MHPRSTRTQYKSAARCEPVKIRKRNVATKKQDGARLIRYCHNGRFIHLDLTVGAVSLDNITELAVKVL